MSEEEKLHAFLDDSVSPPTMWWCRGKKNGCNHQPGVDQKRRCPNCVEGRESETIEELMDRMDRTS
jgi:hypothetical protein